MCQLLMCMICVLYLLEVRDHEERKILFVETYMDYFMEKKVIKLEFNYLINSYILKEVHFRKQKIAADNLPLQFWNM